MTRVFNSFYSLARRVWTSLRCLRSRLKTSDEKQQYFIRISTTASGFWCQVSFSLFVASRAYAFSLQFASETWRAYQVIPKSLRECLICNEIQDAICNIFRTKIRRDDRKSEFEMNCAPRVLNLTSEIMSSPWRHVSFYDVASRFHTSRVLSLCVNRVLS